MTQQHIQFEAKKDGMRQNQDGLLRITLAVHPTDVDTRLLSDPMGKRYQVVMVDADALEDKGVDAVTGTDMDVPQEAQSVPVAESMNKLVQQAAIIAEKPEWDNYVKQAFPNMQERGAEAMRKILDVKSRREIGENVEVAGRFALLRDRFNDYQKYGVV